MLQIMCWVDSEDYWYLNSMNEKKEAIDYYVYRFVVEGGGEGMGSSAITLLVAEFNNAKMSVGFVIPNDFKLDKDITFRFICNDSPSNDIAVETKLSDEVKKASYMGDDHEKIEYIGFTLEKFYEGHDAKFYLNDLRPRPEGSGEGSEEGAQP